MPSEANEMQDPIHDNGSNAPAFEILEEPEDESLPEDLSLGELDFTSQDISLKGIALTPVFKRKKNSYSGFPTICSLLAGHQDLSSSLGRCKGISMHA